MATPESWQGEAERLARYTRANPDGSVEAIGWAGESLGLHSREAMRAIVEDWLASQPPAPAPVRKPWHLRLRQRIDAARFRLVQRAHDRLFGRGGYCPWGY